MKLCEFYNDYAEIFPSYALLLQPCQDEKTAILKNKEGMAKYMYRNIRRKQKIIDEKNSIVEKKTQKNQQKGQDIKKGGKYEDFNKNNFFFTPSFEVGLLKVEKSILKRDRQNFLRKLCFSTSINEILDEFIMKDTQEESKFIKQNIGKVVEPLIITDYGFVQELQRTSKRQITNQEHLSLKDPLIPKEAKLQKKKSWYPAKSPQRLPPNQVKTQRFITPIKNSKVLYQQDLRIKTVTCKFQIQDPEQSKEDFELNNDSPLSKPIQHTKEKAIPMKQQQSRSPINSKDNTTGISYKIQSPKSFKTPISNNRNSGGHTRNISNFEKLASLYTGGTKTQTLTPQKSRQIFTNAIPSENIVIQKTTYIPQLTQIKLMQSPSQEEPLKRRVSDEMKMISNFKMCNQNKPNHLLTQAKKVKESLIKKQIIDSQNMQTCETKETARNENTTILKDNPHTSQYNPQVTNFSNICQNNNSHGMSSFYVHDKASLIKNPSVHELEIRTKIRLDNFTLNQDQELLPERSNKPPVLNQLSSPLTSEQSRKMVTSIKKMIKTDSMLSRVPNFIANQKSQNSNLPSTKASKSEGKTPVKKFTYKQQQL